MPPPGIFLIMWNLSSYIHITNTDSQLSVPWQSTFLLVDCDMKNGKALHMANESWVGSLPRTEKSASPHKPRGVMNQPCKNMLVILFCFCFRHLFPPPIVWIKEMPLRTVHEWLATSIRQRSVLIMVSYLHEKFWKMETKLSMAFAANKLLGWQDNVTAHQCWSSVSRYLSN